MEAVGSWRSANGLTEAGHSKRDRDTPSVQGRREAATIVPVPMGLDSAGVARWVAQQRTACRGRLVTLLDEGGTARDFDSTATRTEFRYHSYLAGVQCWP